MTQDLATLRVAAVGAGDPSTVDRLLRGFPDTVEFAVVLSSPLLPDRVCEVSPLPVVVVENRTPVEHGRVYVLPSDRDVRFSDGHLVVGDANGDRPVAGLDTVLRSIADEVGPSSVAVVLAGHGAEGALGIQRIKEAGGWTLAQDISGDLGEMPRAAIATGLIDLVLPLDQIAARLTTAAHDDVRELEPAEESVAPDPTADTVRDILTLVRIRSGHDFTSYKRATMVRRIARRMQVCECETIGSYHRYLRDHPGELGNLLRDFLISVTQFFRDPEMFDLLARDVIPRLFAHKGRGDQVRVWIAGCASGEEAYSFGMLLLEHAARLRAAPQIQIFATDIDDKALAVARQGTYPAAIAVDVTPERLQRFFVRENGHYRVHKDLREIVLFSPHNLLRDPPFSRLDLVSCRNVLIYLDRDAQHRMLAMFHFGLRADGLLVLGSSESAEGSTLFAATDPKHRVFVRRPAPPSFGDSLVNASRWQHVHAPPVVAPPDRAPPAGELHYRLIEQYAPPSMLVNEDLEVVHLSEHAGRYLQVAGGEPTRQLLRLVHPALRLDLRTAIYSARQHGSDLRSVRFEDDGRSSTVEIRVRVVDAPELGRGAMLVMFAEPAPSEQLPAAATADP